MTTPVTALVVVFGGSGFVLGHVQNYNRSYVITTNLVLGTIWVTTPVCVVIVRVPDVVNVITDARPFGKVVLVSVVKIPEVVKVVCTSTVVNALRAFPTSVG